MKTPVPESLFNKVADTLFTEHLRTTASAYNISMSKYRNGVVQKGPNIVISQANACFAFMKILNYSGIAKYRLSHVTDSSFSRTLFLKRQKCWVIQRKTFVSGHLPLMPLEHF